MYHYTTKDLKAGGQSGPMNQEALTALVKALSALGIDTGPITSAAAAQDWTKATDAIASALNGFLWGEGGPVTGDALAIKNLLSRPFGIRLQNFNGGN